MEHRLTSLRTRARLVPTLVLLLTFGLYARTLHNDFLSETFIWIRYVSTGTFSDQLVRAFTHFLLSSATFSYYRPVYNLLLRLEYQAWGIDPTGYHLIALLLHCANVALVMWLTNLLTQPQSYPLSALAGLLFAVYPLHPNSVVFIAAHPVPATFFILSALISYLYYARTGQWRFVCLSLAAFLLALGSYELAIITPVLLAVCAGVVKRPTTKRALVNRFLSLAPFGALLVLYGLGRRVILGSFQIGPTDLNLVTHTTSFIKSLPLALTKLANPIYGGGLLRYAGDLLFLLLLFSLLYALPVLFKQRPSPSIAVLSLAWVISCLFLSPESVVVPATGRYWYLAAVGLSIGLAYLLTTIASALQRAAHAHGRRGLIWALLLCAFLPIYDVALLNQNLDHYEEASAKTRQIRAQLLDLASRRPANTVFLFGNYPYFIGDKLQIAQVFHWGLVDSLQPPFTQSAIDLFPLPPFAPAELLPILYGQANFTLLSWDDALGKIQMVKAEQLAGSMRSSPEPPTLEILYPEPNASLRPGDPSAAIVFAPGRFAEFRLTILTHADPLVIALSAEQAITLSAEVLQRHPDSPIIIACPPEVGDDAEVGKRIHVGDRLLFYPLPIAYMADINQTYGHEVLVWVEARNRQKQMVAHSRVMQFKVDGAQR